MHLAQIQRHHNQSTAINLNNPESQSMHLETRLVQLDSAISMELWQVGWHRNNSVLTYCSLFPNENHLSVHWLILIGKLRNLMLSDGLKILLDRKLRVFLFACL